MGTYGAFDSSTTTVRIAKTALGVYKLAPPEVKIKSEKGRLIGEQAEGYSTPGIAEISDPMISMTLKDWHETFLPACPAKGGWMNARFVVTTTDAHPMVSATSYSTIWESCRIIGQKPSEIEQGSEKVRVMDLTLQIMGHHEMGADGVWKSAYRRFREKVPKVIQALML